MNPNGYNTISPPQAGCGSGCSSTSESSNLDFGKRLRRLREEKGLSRNDLAKSLGVAMSSIQRFEEGSFPKGDIIIKICEVLGTTTDWLLRAIPSDEGIMSQAINEKLFIMVIERLEAFLNDTNIKLPPSKKARVALLLYKASTAKGEVDTSIIETLSEVAS